MPASCASPSRRIGAGGGGLSHARLLLASLSRVIHDDVPSRDGADGSRPGCGLTGLSRRRVRRRVRGASRGHCRRISTAASPRSGLRGEWGRCHFSVWSQVGRRRVGDDPRAPRACCRSCCWRRNHRRELRRVEHGERANLRAGGWGGEGEVDVTCVRVSFFRGEKRKTAAMTTVLVLLYPLHTRPNDPAGGKKGITHTPMWYSVDRRDVGGGK